MGRYRVTLTFVMDDEQEAWGVAEIIEDGAIKRGWREANSWVTPEGATVREFLVNEGEPPMMTDATHQERGNYQPTMIGDSAGGVTLGGDHGESG